MRPTWVSMPVAVTTQVARPLVMTVEEMTMLDWSPTSVSSASTAPDSLDTGTDSPVMADSSTFRLAQCKMRPSAGTKSPASSRMMSPGTSWAVSRRRVWPSRTTLARGADICSKASRALWALFSWVMEITAFTTTMRRMITASIQSSPWVEMRERAAAKRSTTIMGSLSWRRKRRMRGVGFGFSSWLGPYCWRRWAAWVEVRPRLELVSNSWRAWAELLVYHWVITMHSFVVRVQGRRGQKKTNPHENCADWSIFLCSLCPLHVFCGCIVSGAHSECKGKMARGEGAMNSEE